MLQAAFHRLTAVAAGFRGSNQLMLAGTRWLSQPFLAAGLLGRVGSVIQVAIYGVRSVGALLGGIVAARLGFGAAMALIVGLFAASLLAVLLSSLARLRTLPPPISSYP